MNKPDDYDREKVQQLISQDPARYEFLLKASDGDKERAARRLVRSHERAHENSLIAERFRAVRENVDVMLWIDRLAEKYQDTIVLPEDHPCRKKLRNFYGLMNALEEAGSKAPKNDKESIMREIRRAMIELSLVHGDGRVLSDDELNAACRLRPGSEPLLRLGLRDVC